MLDYRIEVYKYRGPLRPNYPVFFLNSLNIMIGQLGQTTIDILLTNSLLIRLFTCFLPVFN